MKLLHRSHPLLLPLTFAVSACGPQPHVEPKLSSPLFSFLEGERPFSSSLPPCGNQPPHPVSIAGALPSSKNRIPLGQLITLSAPPRTAGSAAHWIIQLPESASPIHQTGTELTLTPQYPGVVSVQLIIQEADGSCGIGQTVLGVSTEEPFAGAGPRRALDQLSGLQFEHLSRIGIESQPNSAGAGVTIAVLDTGVNFNHPDLSPNILPGRDFVDSDETPFDDNGHGTHVAGLAAGVAGGVAPQAKILPVRVLNTLGEGRLSAIADGIRYAVDQGAQVLVLSFGLPQALAREILLPAAEYAAAKGALLVVAAGNQATDIDQTPYYPASFSLPNLLSVGAIGDTGSLAPYSNYGKNAVHLAAPGGDPLTGGLVGPSHLPSIGDGYTQHWGTSMAAPLVAGAAARIWAENPHLNAQEVKKRLLALAKPLPSLSNRIESGSVLNLSAPQGASP